MLCQIWVKGIFNMANIISITGLFTQSKERGKGSGVDNLCPTIHQKGGRCLFCFMSQQFGHLPNINLQVREIIII